MAQPMAAVMAEAFLRGVDVCQRHGKPLQDEHTCPYAEEINDDHESLCRCCEDCEQDCGDDI